MGFCVLTATGAIKSDSAVIPPSIFSHIVKAVDESVASSTTPQNDDELVLPVLLNTVYLFELMLFVTSAAINTPDILVGFTIPAGATLTCRMHGYDTIATTTTANNIANRYQNTTPTTPQPAGVLTSATQPVSPVHIKGILRVGGTSGNLQVQWAQNTSGSTATVVKADSYLKLTKI